MSVWNLVFAVVFWAIVIYRWHSQRAWSAVRADARAGHGDGPRPFVSIILPARNEHDCIERCVRSLLAQDYPAFEIVAIDDCSEDDTGEILERLRVDNPRLRVVRGTPAPPGCLGKAHAIVQAYSVARGDWLLFTDADTSHAPWLLSGVIAVLQNSSASFATVCGIQRHPSAGVYLANLGVFTGMLLLTWDPRGFQEPASRMGNVNGQYVIFSRQAYEAIGTHAAVQWYSSTDASLGYLAKLQGWIPLLVDSAGGLETTMYRSTRAAFQGWSRSMVNMAWTAFGRTRGTLVLASAIAATSVLWIGPWLIIWRAAVDRRPWDLTAGIASVLAGLTLLRLPRRRWRSALRAMLAMPASCVCLMVMGCVGLGRAWWRGGTVWKGRQVQTAQELPPWRPHAPRPRCD